MIAGSKSEQEANSQLEHMGYEKIIEEIRQEFPNQKITGAKIAKFFQKKTLDGEKKIQELTIEQKNALE